MGIEPTWDFFGPTTVLKTEGSTSHPTSPNSLSSIIRPPTESQRQIEGHEDERTYRRRAGSILGPVEEKANTPTMPHFRYYWQIPQFDTFLLGE